MLVPKLMERELLRHFHRRAEEVAAQIVNAHTGYPADKLALVQLPPQQEIAAKCLAEMKRQWSEFKEHFVVESLPIVGNLEDVVDWYFAVLPPFTNKKPKEFPDAMIISALDDYHKQHHANIAMISLDGGFLQACASRSYCWHFDNLKKYTEAFQPELSGKERLPGDIDPTIPITTEDLTELKTILSRGGRVTQIELDRAMRLLESRGTNYDYFFQNANDIVWLSHLSEKGYFDSLPDVRETIEGHIDNPWWPPMDYLIRMFDDAPAEVTEILTELPDTDNFRVLEGIFQIVLKADSADTILKFARFIISYIEQCRWGHDHIISLLKKPFIFNSRLSEFTPTLLMKIVEFRRDPHEQEKEAWRKDDPEALETLLVPSPRFHEWEYQQILEKGIRPLADDEPYQVARVLIDAVASMIRLGMHQQEFDEGTDWDNSEVWCRKLDMPDPGYQDIRGSLVQTLTYACEQVYQQALESIDTLDQTLRNHRWMVFRRLRQHLYISYPNERTLPWIREQILSHMGYSKWEHHYEFQLMIRKASEHFGPRLLSEDEKEKIFGQILKGPLEEDYREWMEERYSNEAFQKRQRYFHCKQLRPFSTLLSRELRDYYDKLEAEFDTENITDDSYLLFSEGIGGTVRYRSPKSIEDLQILTDEELISYLNEWDQEHLDKDDVLVEINIDALAGVFQTLFKEQIVHDDERLAFWMWSRAKIARPVYVAAMLKAMVEFVKERNFDKLDQWIEFCGWVLSHPDPVLVEGQPEPREESSDHPDWSRSRRAVLDFIDACVNKDTEAPIAARNGLANLLQQVCKQPDWRLDHDRPVLLNQDNSITEAINNTRSRGLDSLVNYGSWVRRSLPEDNLQEVIVILNERMANDAEIPLTRPEHALLGLHFGNLCLFNLDWATQKRENIFPQGNQYVWWDSFGSYLRFNKPATSVFEILRDEFQYATDNLAFLSSENVNSGNLVNKLGQHLFTYYLWEVYPLEGDESLLEKFYTKTGKDRTHWATLFEYIGQSLRNSDRHLNEGLKNRVIDFFDWRLQVAEPVELNTFTYWLAAECLDLEWRLKSFSKTLDLGQRKGDEIYQQVKYLANFLQDHLALVVECFAKITDSMNQNIQFHIPADEAKAILKAGLNSEDQEIKANAERAQENLLRSGGFQFLDIDQLLFGITS